jgi:hypothetical protein
MSSITPALLKRTWSLLSAARKRPADVLIVERSLRSRYTKIKAPEDVDTAVLMSSIALLAFSSERAKT